MKKFLFSGLMFVLSSCSLEPVFAQISNGQPQIAARIRAGAALPTTGCRPGDVYYKTTSTVGAYINSATGTCSWDLITEGSTGGGVVGTGTSGRVAFWTAGDTIGSDTDLTFATDTLTATKIITTTLTDSGLTAGRVVFAGTGGLLSNDTDLTFATDTLTATNIVGSNSFRLADIGGLPVTCTVGTIVFATNAFLCTSTNTFSQIATGISAPSGEILYGTGGGITSSSGFTLASGNLYVGSSGSWKAIHASDFVMESSSIQIGHSSSGKTGCFASVYDENDMTERCFSTGTNGNTPDLTIATPTGSTLTVDATTFKVGGAAALTVCTAGVIKAVSGILIGFGIGVTC